MTVDDEGRLWSAVWGAGRIRCHAPDGTLLLTVPVPALQPTSVCPTGSELLVTTARYGLDAPARWTVRCCRPPAGSPHPRRRPVISGPTTQPSMNS